MCDSAQFNLLKSRVEDVEKRLNKLEASVGDVHTEVKTGLASVNGNINMLSAMMVNMDKRMVESREKWGDTLRMIVKWTVRVLLAVVAGAAGVNITKSILAIYNAA